MSREEAQERAICKSQARAFSRTPGRVRSAAMGRHPCDIRCPQSHPQWWADPGARRGGSLRRGSRISSCQSLGTELGCCYPPRFLFAANAIAINPRIEARVPNPGCFLAGIFSLSVLVLMLLVFATGICITEVEGLHGEPQRIDRLPSGSQISPVGSSASFVS